MGRLQKKKDPSKKKELKKRKDELQLSEDGVKTDDAQKRVVTFQKKVTSQNRSSVLPKDKNFFGKAIQFLREVKIELKKVTWPSRKQTMGSTIVVIVLVMIISLFLGMVDMGLSNLIKAFL